MPFFPSLEQIFRFVLYEERPDFLIGGFPGLLPGPHHFDYGLYPQLRQHRQKYRVHDLLILANQVEGAHALEQVQSSFHGEQVRELF